jgi:hypothetical protein
MVCLCYGLRLERGGDSHEKPSLLSPQKQWSISSMWWGSPKDDQVAFQCILMPVVYVPFFQQFLLVCNILVSICWVWSIVLQAEALQREVQSLRGEIVGAEEREATMLAQYVKSFFHSVCLQVFLLLLWLTKLIGLQEVHLHFSLLICQHWSIAIINSSLSLYCKLLFLWKTFPVSL